jgi:NDP-sugar pyrophosphorylase family protein
VAFVEKPPKGKAPTNWINAGTYVLEPSVLQRIPERLTVSIERETFPRMLQEPSRMYAMATDAYWIDIGTPEKYLQAHADVLAGVLGGVPAPGARETAPGIWVQGEADIHPDARIEAPALIGPGALVADGARVARSVVGAGVTVGAGARLLRSVVHAHATIRDDAEAIDSVVSERAILGVGAIASDHTIVGADAELAAGARASGARIRRPDPAPDVDPAPDPDAPTPPPGT